MDKKQKRNYLFLNNPVFLVTKYKKEMEDNKRRF